MFADVKFAVVRPETVIAPPDPTTVNEEHEAPVEQVSVPVAIFPKSAGVALFEVQYERKPAVSFVEVETVPVPPPPEAEMLIGVEPMTVKAEHDALPVQDAVVVATD